MPDAGLIDGERLRAAWAAASRHLHARAAAIDAINEYPVPDGDTGSNMAATLDRAVEEMDFAGPNPPAAEVLRALAKGALYGARGNSGVIFSQALRGLATGVADAAEMDAASLAAGMTEAARAAYTAVANPVEGTMLTVMRLAGEAAVEAAAAIPEAGRGQPCLSVLARAVEAAELAEENTITQLPELQEAGVPDAGGEGVCTILRGLLAALTGQAPLERPLPERAIASRAGHEAETFGFCTEFLLEGDALDVDHIRELVAAGDARSVVVVGDPELIRVHLHTAEPQALVDRMATIGRLSRVKMEDMSAQHERLLATGSGAGTRTGLLALSPGPGFDELFRSLGAAIAPLGEMVKPAAGDIASAADRLAVADLLVLPNHRNVFLAARQAANIARTTLHIVPAATLPQGIAAALAYDASRTPAENVTAMTAALAEVRTVEVTIASADRVAEGIHIRQGEAIALVDNTLVSANDDPLDALVEGLRRAGASTAGLITLYTGANVDPAAQESARDRIAGAFEGVELEVLAGGQSLYPFIASVES